MHGEKSDRDWFFERAREEDNRFVCVGGLPFAAFKANDPTPAQSSVGHLAFARLISLRRRSLKLTPVQLAEKADIDLDELVEIEMGQPIIPEPRTICQLASTLKLPEKKLMHLSGLTGSRDEQLGKAAVRFAASSGSLEKLTTAEVKALEEFVRVLGAEP